MSYKNILLALSFFLIVACNRKNEKNRELAGFNTTSTHRLSKIGQMKLPLDSITPSIVTSYGYLNKNGEEYFVLMNTYNNSLYYYSLETQKIDFIEQFSIDGPSGVGQFSNVTEFKFLGDSLAIYDRTYKRFILLNKDREIVHKYDFGMRNPDSPYGIYGDWLLEKDGNYSFSVSPVSMSFQKINVPPDSLEITYNPETYTQQKAYMPLPDSYLNESWLIEHLTYCRSYNPIDDVFAYSWTADDNIYFRQGSGEMKSKYFGSSYVNTIRPITGNKKVLRDFSAKLIFYYQQGRYGKLAFDPYRKIYLRSAFSGIEEHRIDMNDPLGDTTSFKNILIIGDKDLNKIGEFHNSSMSGHVYFFRPNGIYIMRNTDDEDYLLFDIYNLELK